MSRFTPTTLDMFARFNWPGNIRELQNEVERAVCLAGPDKEIGIDCLSEKITAVAQDESFESGADLTLQKTVQRIEKKMIVDALRKSRGNRSQAARTLGLTRQGLLNKIGRYGIDI